MAIGKVLVNHSGIYKKYNNGNWLNVSTSPTEADYLNGNTLDEISAVPESAWKQLIDDVELCYYTDDLNKTEALFNFETESFTLADYWAEQTINVVEYTDNPNQTESKVSFETDPLTFYDEMGENVDLLYYTDDPKITNSTLYTTANYCPIDELVDPTLLLWTDDTAIYGKTVQYKAVPKPKLIIQTVDIVNVGVLQKFELSALQQGFGFIKLVISGDGGSTWKTVKTYPDGRYIIKDIDITDFINVKKNGMSPDTLSLLTTQDLNHISPSGRFRFAYFIEQNVISDVAKIDKLLSYEIAASSSPSVSAMNIMYDAIDKRYSGLMFMDTGQNYYTTSMGQLLKYLDFGSLIAGQTSIDINVKLTNTYPFNVNNIKLWSVHTIQGVEVQLSKSNSPFTAENEITFTNTLKLNEVVDFYVRLVVDAKAQTGGNFDIRVSADPV